MKTRLKEESWEKSVRFTKFQDGGLATGLLLCMFVIEYTCFVCLKCNHPSRYGLFEGQFAVLAHPPIF